MKGLIDSRSFQILCEALISPRGFLKPTEETTNNQDTPISNNELQHNRTIMAIYTGIYIYIHNQSVDGWMLGRFDCCMDGQI